MSFLLDSAAPVSDTVLRQPGVLGVVRYLSSRVANQPRAKDLSVSEAAKLRSLGKTISLVWETTAARAFDGRAEGERDARDANAEADFLGYPGNCPIFFACDTDASPAQVQPYFAGVKAVSRRPVGAYGGAIIVNAAMRDWGFANGWQANARSWDHGQTSPQANLHQRIQHPSLSEPGNYDENVLSHDFPRWGASVPPPPPPPLEDEMPAPGIAVDHRGRVWSFVQGKETGGHRSLWARINDGRWFDCGGRITSGPSSGVLVGQRILVNARGEKSPDGQFHTWQCTIDANTDTVVGWGDLGGNS